MGNLANTASLMRDPLWRDWMTAAAATVADEVLNEDPSTTSHSARKRLAKDVQVVPETLTDRLATGVAATPSVAAEGPTPSEAHEDLILARVRAMWTSLAQSIYPVEGVEA